MTAAILDTLGTFLGLCTVAALVWAIGSAGAHLEASRARRRRLEAARLQLEHHRRARAAMGRAAARSSATVAPATRHRPGIAR